jgi:hypothetical protein
MPRHSGYQQGAMVTRPEEERRHDGIVIAVALGVVAATTYALWA